MRGIRQKLFDSWKKGQAPNPATKLLGIRIVRLAKARSLLEMSVDERHHNLSGTMHGGLMTDIADAAMGIAIGTTAKPDEDFTTCELKMSFLRPHRRGILRAEGYLAKRGRRIAFAEAILRNGRGQVLAKATGTWLMLKLQSAQTRASGRRGKSG